MGCEHNSVLQKLGCLHDLILQNWLAHQCDWVLQGRSVYLHYWILLRRITCQWESVLQRNLVCLFESVLKTTVCVHNSVLQGSVICLQGWVLRTVIPSGTRYLQIPSWGGSTGPGPVPASSPTLWASLHCCTWSSQWCWRHPLHLPPPPPLPPPLQQGMTIMPPYTHVLRGLNISFMAVRGKTLWIYLPCRPYVSGLQQVGRVMWRTRFGRTYFQVVCTAGTTWLAGCWCAGEEASW